MLFTLDDATTRFASAGAVGSSGGFMQTDGDCFWLTECIIRVFVLIKSITIVTIVQYRSVRR